MASQSRRSFVRDHALTIVLLVLFALAIVGSFVTGWVSYVADQQSHHEQPQLLGEQGYMPIFVEQQSQNI